MDSNLNRLARTTTGIAGRPSFSGMLLGAMKSICRFIPSNGFSWVSLDETTLLNTAYKQTGLGDLGYESIHEALNILLKSLDSDARLNIIGRACAHSYVLGLLCNRLRLREDRKRHPEIAGQVVRRPIFITGLPRTGSTLLHALLAQDVEARAPRVWEVMHPSPPPRRDSSDSDPRIAMAAKQLRWVDILMPGFRAAHMIDARLPQECIAISGHSFLSHVFESMFFVTSFRRWHDNVDKIPAYECHKQFLQHLQWKCPGSHWVLKAPSHLFGLDALSRVYPDAGIIMTHRDPLKVLGSCASFTLVMRSPFVHNCIDKKQLGIEIARHWARGAGLAVQFRQESPALKGRFLDVHYDNLVRDPMAVVGDIYTYFDMELTRESQKAMLSFLAQNPHNKHGVHRYRLEEFGLDRETEKNRFEFYTKHYGINSEG